jgi:solute carrier family 35 (UDP-sugar transporter), member A1/2/3
VAVTHALAARACLKSDASLPTEWVGLVVCGKPVGTMHTFLVLVVGLTALVQNHGFFHRLRVPPQSSTARYTTSLQQRIGPQIRSSPKHNAASTRLQSLPAEDVAVEKEPPRTAPLWFPLSTIAALLALVLQNSGLAVTMRASRLVRAPNMPMYYPTSAVVMCELMKLVGSFVLYCREESQKRAEPIDAGRAANDVWVDITRNWKESAKITVPSGLYVVQNNLQYIAMSNLPAEVYQVLINAKVITTAVFSATLLKKNPSPRQWASVLFLSLGVALVQLSLMQTSASGVVRNSVNASIGLIAVLSSCVTSGFAGVSLERILKQENSSMWLRNVEMSIFSIILAGLVCTKDLANIYQNGFLYGFDPIVYAVVFLQAFGGILVSIVVAKTNSIVKGFATSISIIVSMLASAVFLKDFQVNARFLLGALIVCLSAMLYSHPSSQPKPEATNPLVA